MERLKLTQDALPSLRVVTFSDYDPQSNIREGEMGPYGDG
jgi:hypothetical protein